jgi:hypothetical protein
MNLFLTCIKWSFLILVLTLSLPKAILATSEQAYRDYLYQLDTYRQKYNEFKIAKNEYDKFNTLTSQTTALDKTKTMLSSRDILLKTYLLLLNEKLIENLGLSSSERDLYRALISSENVFLDSHSQLIPSIGSLSDSVDVSQNLESHYLVLSSSMQQIIIGLSLGNTGILAKQYDETVAHLKTFINENRGALSGTKQTILDRWMLSVDNKRSLYQQKIDNVIRINTALKAAQPDALEEKKLTMQRGISEAKTYLMEGTSNLHEIITTLKQL